MALLRFVSKLVDKNEEHHEKDDILRIMEAYAWHPYQVKGSTLPCQDKADEENRYLRIDFPGVSKSGVKIWMQGNELCVHAEEEGTKSGSGFGVEDSPRKYCGRFYIDPERYQGDKYKTLIKHGVLKIVIPKIKHN